MSNIKKRNNVQKEITDDDTTSENPSVSSEEERGINPNKNVNWMKHSPGFWSFYILMLIFLRTAMPIILPIHYVWTGVNVIHGLISFIIMHWIKGSPDDYDHGEYRELTFYEQIDEGRPWTKTKKILILIPTLLLLVASVASDYETIQLAINIPIWGILILGKLPEFHRVRLFGINSTVGIDDAIKISNNANRSNKKNHSKKKTKKKN